MFKIVKFLTYSLLGLSITCWGADNADNPDNNKPGLFEKKAWIENMQKELPPVLCNKEQHFIQCYQITPKDCEAFTQILVRACLNSVSIALPQELSKEQGEHWGQIVGRCTFDLYEKFMQKKKKDDLPACQLQPADKAQQTFPPMPSTNPKKDLSPSKAPS